MSQISLANIGSPSGLPTVRYRRLS